MTDILGPAERKGHKCDIDTDRTNKISEGHLGLESAAELPGSTHPRPAGDRLEDTGSCLPGPTQKDALGQRYFVHLAATLTKPREKCKDSH